MALTALVCLCDRAVLVKLNLCSLRVVYYAHVKVCESMCESTYVVKLKTQIILIIIKRKSSVSQCRKLIALKKNKTENTMSKINLFQIPK